MKSPSVGGKLGLAFALVFPLIAWFLGQDIRTAYQGYRNAQHAAQLNLAANQLTASAARR